MLRKEEKKRRKSHDHIYKTKLQVCVCVGEHDSGRVLILCILFNGKQVMICLICHHYVSHVLSGKVYKNICCSEGYNKRPCKTVVSEHVM
jgi:hypothetical protein